MDHRAGASERPPAPTVSSAVFGPAPPVADAGPDLLLEPLDEIELDATRSYDPAGLDIVAVRWELLERPEGSTAEVDAPDKARPSLFLDLAGTYRLQLNVQNRPGLWDPTPDELVLEAVPAESLYVQLSWSTEPDLDLHLLSGSASLFGEGDCNFCNMAPDWGTRGGRDDPHLDWDAIYGYGPEAISIQAPADGAYEIAVHYYGEAGLDHCVGRCEPTTASVRVYADGQLLGKFAHRLVEEGELWRVATVDWQDGCAPRIDEIDTIEHTNQSFCR
ncbi:MAG: hypothetical protein R3F59_04920 [Myxococcota bacterium]